MSKQLQGISVYFGDIHGARLRHLNAALRSLTLSPQGLLCTMDLDQVLSVQDLLDLQNKYQDTGKDCLIVPGNHEAAVTLKIDIDSSTYRRNLQNTNILALIEALHLPQFEAIRAFVLDKLALKGGIRVALGVNDTIPGLLIHGALAGKQEKYLHEFAHDLQQHIKERTDLWLRLETAEHLRANFAAMKSQRTQVMFRGHDHYTALRSIDADEQLCSHQLVINNINHSAIEYSTQTPRSEDGADDLQFIDANALQAAEEQKSLYWHTLDVEKCHVVNCGPYYKGFFGLLRAGTNDTPPAVAFCRTAISFFNEEDRLMRIKPLLSAHQARQGKTFYELFPRNRDDNENG